jgi:membrane-bound metal-dependent hydrolase YbcI (DUF457 family)
VIIGFVVGIIGGVFLSGFSEFFDFIAFSIFIGLSIFGSVIPNIIEPRHSKNHRDFYHSWLILGFCGIFLILLNIDPQNMVTYLISGFLLGYLTHLLLDATSKQSLPKF